MGFNLAFKGLKYRLPFNCKISRVFYILMAVPELRSAVAQSVRHSA